MATVIIGAGIIGLSIAYYLSELDPDLAADGKIHIIENASSPLLSASGYAGGFLAKDWFSPASASLGELSWNCHKSLAAEHDGATNWGYAPTTVYSLAAGARGVRKQPKNKRWLEEGSTRAGEAPGVTRAEALNDDGTPAWFTQQKDDTLEVLDDEGNCAQIVPRRLCEWLIAECQDRGIKLHVLSEAVNVFKDEEGCVAGVKVKKDLEIYEKHAKNIVIAAGAWAPRAFRSIFHDSTQQIPVTPLAGYSATFRSPRLTKPIVAPEHHPGAVCHAVYCSPTSSWSISPEVFSRLTPDGPEIWLGGLNDPGLKLPATADGAAELKDRAKAEELRNVMVAMTGLSVEGDNLNKDDLDLRAESLCFRPISANGCPIISKVSEQKLGKDIHMQDEGGVYIASGHGPWGISLSLGTGVVVAEMILGRKLSASVSRLSLR